MPNAERRCKYLRLCLLQLGADYVVYVIFLYIYLFYICVCFTLSILEVVCKLKQYNLNMQQKIRDFEIMNFPRLNFVSIINIYIACPNVLLFVMMII